MTRDAEIFLEPDIGATVVTSLAVCAWCEKRVKEVEASEWESVPQYLHRNGVSVSHGICHDCMSDVEKLIT